MAKVSTKKPAAKKSPKAAAQPTEPPARESVRVAEPMFETPEIEKPAEKPKPIEKPAARPAPEKAKSVPPPADSDLPAERTVDSIKAAAKEDARRRLKFHAGKPLE